MFPRARGELADVKTLNAVVALVLVLYGNTLVLLSLPLVFWSPDGSTFEMFVLQALASIIAGVIVALAGLSKATTS